MNGSAPNSPDTGSQVERVQNESPNLPIDSTDCCVSTTPMLATTRITQSANAPVPRRNARSSEVLMMVIAYTVAHLRGRAVAQLLGTTAQPRDRATARRATSESFPALPSPSPPLPAAAARIRARRGVFGHR